MSEIKKTALTKFKFTITRDITESVVVTVEASSIDDAHSMALNAQHNVSGWAIDDGNSSSAYIPDPGDFQEVS